MDFFHMVKTIILPLLVSLAFISCTQNTSSNEIDVKELLWTTKL